jgi:ring-1,2-phenylacetyl-CoA epoxidase subunit PaaB
MIHKMTDTQGPRFEVFQQERESRPHQNVGSVHAPHIEMAMQNARDVFVRRPQALNLWVVPAQAILAKTVQEIEADPTWNEPVDGPDGEAETYYVFQKTSQRRAMIYVVHVGEVEAETAEQAMGLALQKYAGDDVYVWWVCPASAVAASDEDDIESMFAPAHDKAYRMPNQYRTITQMMEAKKDE